MKMWIYIIILNLLVFLNPYQFNNSLKLNKGKIKKDDLAVFIDEEFLNKRSKNCEKVIGTVTFECKIRKYWVLKKQFYGN